MKRVGVFCLVLMLLLAACTPATEQTKTRPTAPSVERATENPFRTESTNGVTKTAATNTRTTVKPADKGAFTVLPKPFDEYDAATRKFLISCGLTRDITDQNKQKLERVANESVSRYAPSYESYESETVSYAFYDPAGKFTAFYLKAPYGKAGETKSEAELLSIARRVAGLYIAVSDYRENCRQQEDRYEISYRFFVGKYETHNGVTVELKPDGTVRRLQVQKLNILKTAKEPNIDAEALKRECTAALKQRGVECRSCEIVKTMLEVKDGQLLAYYQWKPDIKDGETTVICECVPISEQWTDDRTVTVTLPLADIIKK